MDNNLYIEELPEEKQPGTHVRRINGKEYKVYPVYYPIGNGMMNIDKAIEDLKFIIKQT